MDVFAVLRSLFLSLFRVDVNIANEAWKFIINYIIGVIVIDPYEINRKKNLLFRLHMQCYADTINDSEVL